MSVDGCPGIIRYANSQAAADHLKHRVLDAVLLSDVLAVLEKGANWAAVKADARREAVADACLLHGTAIDARSAAERADATHRTAVLGDGQRNSNGGEGGAPGQHLWSVRARALVGGGSRTGRSGSAVRTPADSFMLGGGLAQTDLDAEASEESVGPRHDGKVGWTGRVLGDHIHAGRRLCTVGLGSRL